MASCLFEQSMVDRRGSIDVLLSSKLRVAANKQDGQIAFSLVRLLQDLSEKLDIGHKLSSKRFHGQNNSEFLN